MDFSSIDEGRNVRLSNSPASIPIIVEEPATPTRSVHLETMENAIDIQPDPGARAADFFDDTSSDDEDGASTRANAGQTPTPIIEAGPGKRHPASPQTAGYHGGGAAPPERVSQGKRSNDLHLWI